MPIKGLSEKRRLPRLGKIHLGVKKANAQGVEYPSAVDYFVCPTEVQKIFGEQPKELRIMVPLEDEEKWASQYYRCYSMTRGLICKGDGETAIRMIDTATGALANKDTKEVVMKEMTCAGRECPDYKVMCKEVMNLQFLLPEVPGLGIWQIDTGSINSIQNINSAAELIKRLYGHIAMLPLLLTLEAQEAKTPEGKKKNIYVLNLRTRETLSSLMGVSMKPVEQILLPGGDVEVELPVGDDDVPDLIIPQAQDPATQSPIKPVAKPPATETKHLCPIHKNAELYRNEKNGSVWYSHKLENGKYCNGNAPKQSEPPVTTDKKPEATPGAVVGQPKGKIETVTIEQQWNQIGELGRKLGRSTADACKFVGKVQKEWRSIPAAQLADIINAWSQEAAGMEQLPFGEGE